VTGKPYELLAPLPCEDGTPGCVGGQLKTFDPAQTDNLGKYLNIMIKIFIGLCAVLSVVMIVMGGVAYMTSELAHTKEAGKEKITHAVLGLLIALGAYALLNTINPQLLNTNFRQEIAAVVPSRTSVLTQYNTLVGICEYFDPPESRTQTKTEESTEEACMKNHPAVKRWARKPA
jgi:hypothetical protein